MRSLKLLFSAAACTAYFIGACIVGTIAAGSFHIYQAARALGMPLAPVALGANSLGTIVGAHIIQRALELTFQRYPALRAFSLGFRDLDGQVTSAALGQDVYSRVKSVSSVSNFGTAAADFTMTDVPGKLRNFRQIYHKFTAAQVNSTNLNLIDQTAEPMAVALSQNIVASMAGMVSRFNFNSTVNSQVPYVAVASGWTYANTLVPLGTAMDARGIGPNRYFLANPAVNGALMTDTNLVQALNAPWNADAIRTGQMAQIVAGLGYSKYPGFSATDSNLVGFGGTPDALLYIARAPKSPDEVFAAASGRAPFNWAIIQDANSGFSVLVQQWIETDMSVHTRLVWLDGFAPGNTTSLVRLVTGVVSGSSGTIVAAKVENPGYGYVNSGGAATAPTLTISGGGGTGATATCTVDAVGAITGVSITGAGSGYTSVPSIAIAPSSRCDAAATISLTVAGYN